MKTISFFVFGNRFERGDEEKFMLVATIKKKCKRVHFKKLVEMTFTLFKPGLTFAK